VEGKAFMSSFGRMASLIFLVQGNVPLALASLLAGLLGRFGRSDIPRLTASITERLEDCRRENGDQLIRRRKELADFYRDLLADEFSHLFRLLEELSRRGASAGTGNDSQARANLETDRATLGHLRGLAALLRERVRGFIRPPSVQ